MSKKNMTSKEFNEFIFEYTSRIPSDAIERISKKNLHHLLLHLAHL